MFHNSLFVCYYNRFYNLIAICNIKRALPRVSILVVSIILAACSENNSNKFNIQDFGAIPDGSTVNTEAIQMAIHKAAENKGTVIIPKGKFYTGSFTLGPNMTLVLDEGAELIASSRMNDYTNKSFIFAPEADNLTIKGKGVINGNGESFFDENWNYTQRPQPWIIIQDSKNVSISGITLVNSPAHCLVFDFCENVKIDSLTIKNHPRSPNTDGIDITNSKNVLITNCNISTGDDAICIKNKSGSKYFENPWQNRSKYTEDILVKNCILESDDAAIKLGTGSAYHTRNCRFQDITIKNSRYGIALFMMDGGIYSDLSFKNITIKTGGRQKDEYGIFVDTHRRDSLSAIGTIKNISFKDIDITTNGLLYFSGYPEKEISKITLENVKVTVPDADNTITAGWKKPKGNKKIRHWNNTVSYVQSPASVIVAHARDFNIKNLEIQHQQGKMDRHGIYLIDVKGLDTIDVKGNTLYKESFVFTKK